jgi:ribosomal RNA-processing protein 8
VVADFGCGEAQLAASVKQEVHSLDLVAAGPGVIACNMAHTPLDTGSCDVAVFRCAWVCGS